MKPSVRARFVPFTARYEGVLGWMYLDVKNLVTTAIGDLIDTVAEAQALPWVHVQGVVASQYGAGGPMPATKEEIAAEWHYVKSRTDLSQRGGGVFGAITHLRLTDEGILATVTHRLDQMDAYLAKRYPNWEDLPDNAQLGILSMAWAAGPAFHAPHFDAAVELGLWAEYLPDDDGRPVLIGGAAYECHLSDHGNPGLRPRNAANRALFEGIVSDNDGPAANETGTAA